MRTPKEVVERLCEAVGDDSFEALIPIIEGDGIHLNHLRIFFMVQDYWADIRKTQNSAQSYYNIAIVYDCAPITVRYHVTNSLKRLKAPAK
jgi:hypothetical protein